MPLIGLGGDLASQHISSGQILAELLNIVRDNALKLDKILENRDIDNINAEVKSLKEQVTTMNTKLQAIEPYRLITTTSETNQQASVITSTSVETSVSTSLQGCVSTTGQTSQHTSPITSTSTRQWGCVTATGQTNQEASLETSTPTNVQTTGNDTISVLPNSVASAISYVFQQAIDVIAPNVPVNNTPSTSEQASDNITSPSQQTSANTAEPTTAQSSTVNKVPVNSTTHTNQRSSANTVTSPSQHVSLRTTNPTKDVPVTHTLTESQQPPVNSTVPTSQQATMNTATPTTVENPVRKLVEEYNRSGDWTKFYQGLLVGLDERSKAYIQLRRLSPRTANPMYYIGLNGLLDLAVMLLDAGLLVDKTDGPGCTMLQGSASREEVILALCLLDRGADVNMYNDAGETALIHASRGYSLEMVDLLVKRGAYIDWADNYGYTSLHWAASEGRLEIVQYLVQAGADTTARTYDDEQTPLDLARDHGHNVVVYLSKFPH